MGKNCDVPWSQDHVIPRVNLMLKAGVPTWSVEILYRAVTALLNDACADEEEARLSLDWHSPLVKFRLPVLLGIHADNFWMCRENLTATGADHYSYWGPTVVYSVADFEPHRETIEGIWQGPVIIEPMPGQPAGVLIRPAPKVPQMIPLTGLQRNSVIFGTDLLTGDVVRLGVRQIPHLLIVGTSGFGKSVFLNQIITQLLAADYDEVAQLELVDLKGGVEFHSYAYKSNRVRVVWDFYDVVETVESLVELMLNRQDEMVANNWRTYPGERVFFVVDEFAQIQLYPCETKDEKATHARLIANLNRLSMLGRAVGVVLIAAVQKPTTDVMDSSFRMNLQGQICFKVPNRLLASTMFGSVEDLRFDPVKLRKGQFIFYDSTNGVMRYLQSHVAPD